MLSLVPLNDISAVLTSGHCTSLDNPYLKAIILTYFLSMVRFSSIMRGVTGLTSPWKDTQAVATGLII